jgi:TRAP-type mannitol/chloroaromatic compound transport system substrate-binding protein
VKFFQDAGATIWNAWPNAIRKKLREAAIDVINERSAADAEWAAVADSMKAFANNEQTRWAEANEDRESRFEGAKWPGWESIIQ